MGCNLKQLEEVSLMSVSKSVLKYFALIAALAAIFVASGCGPSAEKEKMAAFMQDYRNTLDEYADAGSKGDNGKKAELEAKLDALKDQWLLLKEEIGSEVTPQTMEKFSAEFGKLSKTYAELSGKM
jgi:hypothetical protein